MENGKKVMSRNNDVIYDTIISNVYGRRQI